MPLGPKSALPQVSPGTWPAFNRYLYVSVKQNSDERFRATLPSCLFIANLVLLDLSMAYDHGEFMYLFNMAFYI